MNENLAKLISDYQASVRCAVQIMQISGINLPKSNIDWAFTHISQRGEQEGGVSFFKHGFGCEVKLPSGSSVDFDFGANGEIDGFDVWRLTRFAGSRLSEYGFASAASLNECFNDEIAAGRLVYSGYILYYLAHTT